MGDSQSKQFGDAYLGKLTDQLNTEAPVFGKSLFTGAGNATRDAWDAGTNFSNDLIASGGLTDPMQSALRTFGKLGGSYDAAADTVAGRLKPLANNYGDAVTASDRMLGNVKEGYGDFQRNNGLNGVQTRTMQGLNDIGAGFADTAGLTSGQKDARDLIGGLDSGYASIGAHGGLNADQRAAMDATQGFGGQYADLSGAYDQDAPGYARMRQQLLDDAVTNVSRDFQASGRSGGGSYIDSATEASLNAIAPLDYQNYTNSINNKYRSLDSQKGIQDTLFGEGQTGTTNRLASLAGREGIGRDLFSMGQQKLDNDTRALQGRQGVLDDKFGMAQTGRTNELAGLAGQEGAAQAMFGNRMAGTGAQADIASQIFGDRMAALAGRQGAATSLFNGGQQAITNEQGAIDALSQIGAAQDANAQGRRLGEADLYDRTNNAELDRLLKIGAGFGDPVAAANEAPWWQQMLGYVAGNAGKAVSGGLFR